MVKIIFVEYLLTLKNMSLNFPHLDPSVGNEPMSNKFQRQENLRYTKSGSALEITKKSLL